MVNKIINTVDNILSTISYYTYNKGFEEYKYISPNAEYIFYIEPLGNHIYTIKFKDQTINNHNILSINNINLINLIKDIIDYRLIDNIIFDINNTINILNNYSIVLNNINESLEDILDI